MTEPVYSVSTERLYYNLPELYRIQDATQNWVLKTFLSSMGDVLGDVELLVARLNYLTPDERNTDYALQYTTYQRTTTPVGALPVGQTSDLTDPVSADTAWLPWLAQLVGTKLPAGESDTSWRQLISNASSGWQAGSKQAIVNAIKRVLSGPTYTVRFEDHYQGNPWWIHILTPLGEQSDSSVILSAIDITKPVGVIITHGFFDTIDGDTVTWTESVTDTSNACSFPAENLYPSDSLYPC